MGHWNLSWNKTALKALSSCRDAGEDMKISPSLDQPKKGRPQFVAALIWAMCMALLASHVWSAQQGDLGTAAQGDIQISYVQGIVSRISGLADINLGTWSGAGDLVGNNNICIGRSGIGFFGAGNYRILAQGDGEPGNPAAFTLTNAANHRINYQAFFNDQADIAGRTQLTGGSQLGGQSGIGFAFIFNGVFGCVFPNANLSIIVPEAELQNGFGTYAGTLTLTIIPE